MYSLALRYKFNLPARITLRRGRWTIPKTFRAPIFKGFPGQKIRHPGRRRLQIYTYWRAVYARGRRAHTLANGLTHQRARRRAPAPHFQLQFVKVRRNFWAQILKSGQLKVKAQNSTGHWFTGPKRKRMAAALRVIRWGFSRLNARLNARRHKTFVVIRFKRYNDRSIKWHRATDMLYEWTRGQRPHLKRILRFKLELEMHRPHNGMRPAKLRRV